MYRRFHRAAVLALGGPGSWPSYRGLLALLLLVRLLLSVGVHLGATLASTFTMENMHVPYADTVSIYIFHGCVIFAVTLFASTSIDSLPVLPLVLGSCVVGALLRALVAYAGAALLGRAEQLVLLCVALPLNDAFLRSPVRIALKRIVAVEYAGNSELERHRRNQFIAIFYALHNVGDIIANAVYYRWRLAPGGVLAANTGVIYLSAAVLVAAALVIAIMRRVAPRADRPFVALQKETVLMHTVQKAQFWRYLGIVLVLTCVSSLFLHFDLTLTKHLLIELGPHNPFPLLQSINPVIIIVLSPCMPWLFEHLRVAAYDVLIAGTALSALGCLVLGVLQAVPGVPLAAAYAVGLTLFSIGEAVWSPRLAAYALEIAPEGFEAVYQAFADLPTLPLIFFTPVVSHALIDAYCTSTHCNGAAIWSILGLVAAFTPAALTLLRSCLKD